MAYLGRQLTSGNYLKLDDISSQFNGSLKTFNLTSGGQTFYPGSAYSILVSLGGVIQEPESGYQINENQIIFAVAPQVSDDFFCIVLGTALGIGVPGDGTVSGNKLTRPFNYDSGLLYLDDTNNRVGINSTAPSVALDVIGSARISGNVSVGGTLTYEDVTNIDSIGIITARSDVIVGGGVSAVGVITALGGFNLGISSSGTAITSGPITSLNFVGTGNTFLVNGTTVDISIQGGSTGAGGTFSANAVGVHTTKILGINTTTIAGAANSEGAIQAVGNIALVDGAILTDQNIDTDIFIPAGKNGLVIGPVTVGVGITIDVASGSVLVVV